MDRPDRQRGGGAPAWRTLEKDGWEILVGRGAAENDILTFREAAPRDLWLHAAGHAGSHVIIRIPEGSGPPPADVIAHAAALAAFHSKVRNARGKVDVHVCRVADVRKPRGAPPGQVEIRRFDRVRVYPREPR